MRKCPQAKGILWLICVLGFNYQTVFAQNLIDSLSYSYQDAIEKTVSVSQNASFGYDTEFEQLADFIRYPLSINYASTADFEKLHLLTSEQIQAIIAHRNTYGLYITLQELQTVLDLITIRRILPFVTVEGQLSDYQMPLKEWFKKGKTTVFIRSERTLESAEGFKRAYTEGGYKGDPNRLYLRYRYSFGQHLSYGFTLKKDAGEHLGKPLFDFNSYHFKISNISKKLKTIVLGDYSVSLGQGLIQENGFTIGKNALTLNIEKDKLPLREYTSSNETNFQRGAAVHAQLFQHTEGCFFVSRRRRDANTTDTIDNGLVFSTLQTSGLHRTRLELMDKNAIGLFTIGANLKKTMKSHSIGFNSVFNHFDNAIQPSKQPYNLFSFTGKNLFNFSTDYKATYTNIHLFGETALSSNGGFATLNSMLIGLDKRLSVSILQRFFSLKYQVLQAQPFSESSKIQDEMGIYWGLEYKLNRMWTMNGYVDFWRHQWWRYGVDGPSNGHDFFTKMTYHKRHTEGYAQIRVKTKQENATGREPSTKTNLIVDKTHTQIRLQYNRQLSKRFELRNRLECAFFNDDKGRKKGFTIFQDALYSLDAHTLAWFGERQPNRMKISSRLAFFDTKDYDTAIYSFENDVQYSYTVLPYYYRGTRFYINMSYPFSKTGYIEARFARTHLFNQSSLGSGLDKINGNKQTDVKVQLRFSF